MSEQGVDGCALGFLDLPPEIRIKIYDLLLVNRINERLIDVNGSLLSQLSEIHVAVLRLCKVIHREAAPVLYENNILAFYVPRNRWMIPLAPFSNLIPNKIAAQLREIAFEVTDLARFGKTSNNLQKAASNAFAPVSMQSLHTLHLLTTYDRDRPGIERIVMDPHRVAFARFATFLAQAIRFQSLASYSEGYSYYKNSRTWGHFCWSAYLTMTLYRATDTKDVCSN